MELADYVTTFTVRIASNLHPWATTIVLFGAGVASLTWMAVNRAAMKTKLQSRKIPLPVAITDQANEVPNEEFAKKSKIFATNSDDECMRFLYDDVKTLHDVFQRVSQFHYKHHMHNVTVMNTVFLKENIQKFSYRDIANGNGDCLGKLNDTNTKYEWISYSETIERLKNFGCGLLELGLCDGSQTKLGIYATNCVEYIIAEFGAYSRSMTVVPLYDTLGPTSCSFIINQAEIECVIVDSQTRLEALLTQSSQIPNLKHVIVINKIYDSFKAKAASFGIKVHDFEEVEKLGQDAPREPAKPRPRDLAVICYTSGTTGSPKGAMLSHENIVSNFSSVSYQLGDYKPNEKDTYMSFLPLAHMFERCCVAAVLMAGGRIGFFGGDIRKLSDEMKVLRPTTIPCVPRLFNRIHDKVLSTIKGSHLKEYLMRKALHAKQREVDAGIFRTDSIWDKLVFKKVRAQMGGNLRLVVVGSAPLASNVLNFMRCALGCIICEGYGQTESVSPCTFPLPGDMETGHVGPPLASCYVKLVDVPDMEYYARDGSGEVCVKGPIVFQGYYNDPERTAEVIDNEGWLHTGDVGTWLPNGTLRIIDRKKHIFKLSQGEYIAPEKIESIYSRSSFVSQIFVYGESLKASLIAIVVPENDILYMWARKHNIKGTIRDLCEDPRIKQAVLDDLHQLGKKEGLKTFEQVKDICLHPEQFSIDNGLLTPTLKTKRPECRKFFVKQIQALYRSID